MTMEDPEGVSPEPLATVDADVEVGADHHTKKKKKSKRKSSTKSTSKSNVKEESTARSSISSSTKKKKKDKTKTKTEDETPEETPKQSTETAIEDDDGGHKKQKSKRSSSKSKKKRRSSSVKKSMASKSSKKDVTNDNSDDEEEGKHGKEVDSNPDMEENAAAAAAAVAGTASSAIGNSRRVSDHRNSVNPELDEDGNIVPPKLSGWFGTPAVSAQDAQAMDTFIQRQFRRMARNPCLHLWTALIISLALSFIGLIVGEFEISAETGGWQSRGTLVADRQQQLMMALENQEYLAYGGEDAWNDLIQNVQKGWESVESDDDEDGRRLRQLMTTEEASTYDSSHISFPVEKFADWLQPKSSALYQAKEEALAPLSTDAASPLVSPSLKSSKSQKRQLPFQLSEDEYRRLQDESAPSSGNPFLSGCDISFYLPPNMTLYPRLYPVWQTNSPDTTALDADVLRQQCLAEMNTHAYLEENGLCFGCPDNKCLPPFSVVFYARLYVENGFELSCDELAEGWRPLQQETEQDWQECVTELKETYDPNSPFVLPSNCKFGFYSNLVQTDFDMTLVTQYTSTIFATYADSETIDELYNQVDNFDRGSSGLITAAYDTQYEDFTEMYVDTSIPQDMALALGSAFFVAIAILIHTRSPMITGVGLLQIILSFPLSYFVYKLVAGLDFFPFLNFLGLFVIFALGAGDIFVAIDKFKNARIAHPHNSTEYVAAIAFPDALQAMFLTTLTTAIAFFATAICPVSPIKMFAIFCGLLILFDYILNVLLVFPALVIYDKAMIASAKRLARGEVSKPSRWMCCVSCGCFGLCGPKAKMHQLDDLEDAVDGQGVTASKFIRTPSREMSLEVEEAEERAEHSASFIQKIMLGFYSYLHFLRWPLFVICIAAFSVCIYYATLLKPPLSSDVRLLNDDVMYEQAYVWRQYLLSENLQKIGGARAYMIWGVTPADTGDQNNPASWTQLVLDENFDMSSAEAQLYMRGMCDEIFVQEFATTVNDEWLCPLAVFDQWLKDQAASPSAEDIYLKNCASASSLPVPRDSFDACISSWAQSTGETSILSRSEKVQIIFIPFQSRVRYDDFFDVISDEWQLIEDWMSTQNSDAPEGVSRGYFNNIDFWWWDTNKAMLNTAYTAAAIALGCAAAVILFSSQSLILTIFSTLTIGYVLAAVTAMLVAIGW
eukprot:CAMPEP_0113459858 /NCGR_PEP_ID=MMETSP0014_2-20120614/10681_1 /TAXON_ID=2857 /ORGANISM="Nitzschia sp." /LENGTH=1179 /DNA_ID=CAMNT_0000351479 /DNA_START=293 /DNA_END=3829 /DNA_ORIENTATION=+ /assembly_acc=CAM_ASM_000159